MDATVFAHRSQQVVYDKKWRLLMLRARLFRHIPFVEAVCGAGSLAVGNVKESSDLDVLILTRSKRIFSARFFSVVAFGALGWRRSKLDHRSAATDKICLNHFVTPEAYRFSLEHHEYWRALYRGLIPVYGDTRAITAFFQANEEVAGQVAWRTDLRYAHQGASAIKRLLETVFSGVFGDWFERNIKAVQVRRIERGLAVVPREPRVIQFQARTNAAPQPLRPLITYTDTELEFHPEPAVIQSAR